ncbi:hypothetical protein HU200_043831 [Digitaria exilis]|uniref:Rx N-terminal domain-containing protein n=1 Tax=Digitaria exilis TaxID=1010633 RepID=A0A835B2M5_9POAL|nr:hypothetical protein HU200_043831 [Digitaria exilis]
MDVLPSLQSIAETLANLSKELQFMNELHRLRTSLHTARMLIFRSEWGMSKDKNLAELLSHLKDTTYDAEDHLRVVDDQALRQRIEDADRNRAGQLLSCYLNIAKSLFHRTKTRIKETQDKLDKAVADIEKALSLMGLTSIDPSQMMPETSSIISAPEVVGRDDERDDLINKLGVTIGREAQRDQCAFGTNDPESYPHLQDIGQSISTRLCGSPLDAKTLGRLLNMSLTEQHWTAVQKSELWELPHEDNEILPALQLSYLYLPEKVKRCFVFCSMFPKDFCFDRDEIVDIWVAQGFVEPRGSMRSEDVGFTYLDELRNRFLFQADPKFPNKPRYVMHDLIHDMAVSFSMDECLVMQDFRNRNKSRMHDTVRHMSIEVEGESLIRVGHVQNLNKLHSLRFGIRFDVEITWFSQLSNILYLSLKGCKLVKLPESICELSSLRYLDISHSSVQELPRKFWCLYSLQVLYASRSSVWKIHEDVTKLVNLRQLALPSDASQSLSRVPGLGNLSCLRNLSEFTVARKNGRGIGELKFMNQLNGRLYIRCLYCVGSEEEASEARLVEKQYLKELVLQWRQGLVYKLVSSENGVLEGLRPHPRIECLKFIGFSGDRLPSWFKPEDMPFLRSLELSSCGPLESLSIPFHAGFSGDMLRSSLDVEQENILRILERIDSIINRGNGIVSSAFKRLAALRVYRCWKLRDLEQFLTPENLPCIESIILEDCWNLKSIPIHSFEGFDCLCDLKICRYHELKWPREMVLPYSLQRLCIVSSKLDMSFPACLENLTSLTLLQLGSCDNIRCLPLNLICSNTLKCLAIRDCQDLSSIGGLHALASIQHVQISSCPYLDEVQQPFEKKELQTKEEKEPLKFLDS